MNGTTFPKGLLFGRKPRAFVLAVLIEVVLVLGVLFTVGLTPAQAQQSGEIEWIRQFGSPSGDWAMSISAHSSGVYVFGDVEGALPGQTSLGARDVYVRKYRPNGKKVWTRQFGTTLKDFARGISVNSTGVYLAGSTKGPLPGQEMVGSHDAFVRKYTFNGKEVWTRQFGSSIGAGASAIAVGSTGVYVAGSAEAPLPDQTSVGGYVRKYDTNGNHIWTHQFGNGYPFRISVDSTGVYVAGRADGALPGQTGAGGSDAFVRKYDADGTLLWTRQFGTSSSDAAGGISVDSTGVYVAGYTSGALPGQTNAGSDDVFVRKYDADGNLLWTRQFGTSSDDHAGGISVSDGGVYVAGETEGTLPGQTSAGYFDAFVRKYDADGVEVWTHQFGSSPDGSVLGDDFIEGISVGAKGVYVAGGTDGTLSGQTSAGDYDAFVVKLSKSGTVTPPDTGTDQTAWTRQFGSSLADEAFGVSVDVSGVYVAGYTFSSDSKDAFLSKYNLDGTEVWTRQFGSFSLADEARGVSVDSSGVYVAGYTFSSVSKDAFISKYEVNGNLVWARQFGSIPLDDEAAVPADEAHGVSVDTSGVYLSGWTNGTLPGQLSSENRDAFVRKYNFDGTEVWTSQFGSSSVDEAHGVSVEASGVYVAGHTLSALPGQTSAGGQDGFVQRHDADGTLAWTRQFGSSLDDNAFGVSADVSGVYVAGWTNGTLPGQTSAGSRDAFLRKYDLNGTLVWTRQFGSSLADEAFGVSVDASGVYVAGKTGGNLPGQTSAGSGDAFVRKYDLDGNLVWTRQFGSSLADEAFGVSVDASGAYVAGKTVGTLPGQTSAGGDDAFAARLPLTGTMHVASIDISFLTEGRKVEAVAQVLMEDEDELPVPGATVTGAWFLNGKLINEGTFGTTGSDGVVTISSGRINRAKSGDTIGFCVTGATGSHNYVASDNVETCDQDITAVKE